MTHDQAISNGWKFIGSTMYTKEVDGVNVYEVLSDISYPPSKD